MKGGWAIVRRAVLVVILGGAVAVCFVLPPEALQGPLLCPFRLLVGLPCPFCGLTRSAVLSARLDIGRAVAFHPLGPVALLILISAAIYSIVLLIRPSLPSLWDLMMSRLAGKVLKVATFVMGVIWGG